MYCVLRGGKTSSAPTSQAASAPKSAPEEEILILTPDLLRDLSSEVDLPQRRASIQSITSLVRSVKHGFQMKGVTFIFDLFLTITVVVKCKIMGSNCFG